MAPSATPKQLPSTYHRGDRRWAAGAEALLEQLADGGRLVIPVGPEARGQELVRVRRDGDAFDEEDLGPVRFVPLVGAQGFAGAETTSAAEPVTIPMSGPGPARIVTTPSARTPHGVSALVAEVAEPFESIAGAEVGPLLDRIGDCPVVLLGEASHGTSEFYRMRAHITRELIRRKGFTVVALEADWPDAARIDAWVRHRSPSPPGFTAFSRFPTWMWRNREVAAFIDWLREHNAGLDEQSPQVSFSGLDLYSMFTSRDAVLAYLDRVDPEAAKVARARYGCLTPWEHDPARYGRAVVTGRFAGCERRAWWRPCPTCCASASTMRPRRRHLLRCDPERFGGRQRRAVLRNAMYYGSVDSWNLEDTCTRRSRRSERSVARNQVVVWEHNSHVGDASATEMGARGEHNVGMLCRRGANTAAARSWSASEPIAAPSQPRRVGWRTDGAQVGATVARPQLQTDLSATQACRLSCCTSAIRCEMSLRRAHASPTSSGRSWRDLPTRDGTAEPLLRAVCSAAVRRVHMVRRDRRGTPLPAHEIAAAPDTYPFGL
ncbi:MAG: erythromycin esterase family protein [Microthrixaceae bacterium]